MAEWGLRKFKNSVLRGILRQKREEVTGSGRRYIIIIIG
jgi:hypothetical protein